jgi:hypothetical protein
LLPSSLAKEHPRNSYRFADARSALGIDPHGVEMSLPASGLAAMRHLRTFLHYNGLAIFGFSATLVERQSLAAPSRFNVADASHQISRTMSLRLRALEQRYTLPGPHRRLVNLAHGTGLRRKDLIAYDFAGRGRVGDNISLTWPIARRRRSRFFPVRQRAVSQESVWSIRPANVVDARVEWIGLVGRN